MLSEWARLLRFPPSARTAPEQTRAILRFAVEKTFRVTSTAEGRVGLDLSPLADRRFGGFMHEVWVDAEDVEADSPRLNEAHNRPALADVIHLAHGESTSGHLRSLGAKHVLMMRDHLGAGPTSRDPMKHKGLRSRYWREFYRHLDLPFRLDRSLVSADQLADRFKQRNAREAVVVWGGARWAEVLFLWWACDALVRLRVSPADVWLAMPGEEYLRYSPQSPNTPAQASDAELRRLFSFSRRSTARQLRTGSRLWSAFSTGELGALQEARAEGHPGAALAPIPNGAHVLVPRVRKGRQRRLLLSDYDQRLLGMFSSGLWSSALGRLQNRPSRMVFMSLLSEHGDQLIPVRLAEWAKHRPDVLECRPVREPVNVLGATEYRLTRRGLALLETGLENPIDAPPIAMGGFEAYSAHMKWLCEIHQDGWRWVRA